MCGRCAASCWRNGKANLPRSPSAWPAPAPERTTTVHHPPMHAMTRRTVLETLLASGAAHLHPIDAVSLAAKLGFDGVQVSLGRKPASDKLPLDDASIQAQYLDAAKQHGDRKSVV